MATEVIVVVGKNPLDDKFGFNAIATMTYGSFIPDKLYGSLVNYLMMDESAGTVQLALASGTNDMGTNAAITLESGATIDLTGVDGVYTAGTPSTTFTDILVGKIDGVCNMVIGSMSSFSSATTTDGTTIEVTLDQAAENTSASNWTVDINSGTNNVVTSATVSGTTVTLVVTDTIVNGDTITVSHTRTTEINTITDQAVTNTL